MYKPLTELELIVMDHWQSEHCQDYPRRAAAEIRWRRAEAEDAIEHAMIAARYIGKLEADNARLREALERAEGVMAKNVYPCPDKPKGDWAVLQEIRAVLAQPKEAR